MGKKIKIVLDTNVWLSIFMNKALSKGFSKILGREDIQIYISKQILEEISRVLVYPKIVRLFEKVGISSKEILEKIVEKAILIKPKLRLNIIKEDPADNRILECALQAKADFLVSGNKHLIKLKKFKNIKILKPREFLELLKSS
ncbi:MAG: putative toxin-antitoxin system toxin component, PIN family [Candidatus Aenigmatarchaeota archaeon]|nr:MAG: putative toxin-antitoxin system toxin component, PIN family [Candidatus Aenigmarchaeota archaeon]